MNTHGEFANETAENMRYFIDDLSQLNAPALGIYLERAKGLYEENMSTYVKLMLRRSFGRLMVRGNIRQCFLVTDF